MRTSGGPIPCSPAGGDGQAVPRDPRLRDGRVAVTGAMGYTHDEVAALAAEDGRVAEDVSRWDLDTPALCLDLDAFEANLATLQGTVTANGIAARPHAKTHKCPAIARRQLESGAVGVCTATVGEAEVLGAHGIDRVLITTPSITPLKITRAMALAARCPELIQATDSAANARDLSEAAGAAGVVARVAVDVDPGGHRTGVAPGPPALKLARLVDRLPGLRLVGVLCYDGSVQHVEGFEERRRRALEGMAPASETVSLMERDGLDTGIFSGGGTGTYNIDHETPGFTDVQAGSYVFMDAQYLAIGGADGEEVYDDFRTSLTILTTVVNDRHEGRATTDAGAKACTINQPWPLVAGQGGTTYRCTSDEFGVLRYGDDASRRWRVGEKLDLVVSHCDPVVNLHDRIFATRKERVEAVWRVAARGMCR